ncbi:trypsin-like peptidase domain-containing protein [Streptomonospora sp. S1-112]|uniref:Trypsin-like peptidase domain-containing protein n=1 Tax=Streptomonospora mangrovi TaxID=2883123 RepID=A0A9X3NL82_9ACTN|nr:trypsin-like peptidase domain-containing protein [Streptomonospora mangrovi]MDA0565547.1 trypsin-like peptidase domain-containing protein [Streptomonospora mangrovi]
MSATDPTKGSPQEGQDGDGRQPEPAEASAADTAVLGTAAAPAEPAPPAEPAAPAAGPAAPAEPAAPAAESGAGARAERAAGDEHGPHAGSEPRADADPAPNRAVDPGADGAEASPATPGDAAAGPGADPTQTPVPWRSSVANRPPRSQSAPRFGEPEDAPSSAAAAAGEPGGDGGAPAEAAPADAYGQPPQPANPYGQTDPYGSAGAFAAPGGAPAWAAPAAAGAAAGGVHATDPYGTAEPGHGPGGYGGPGGPGQPGGPGGPAGPEHAAHHAGGWHAGGPGGPAGPGGPGGMGGPGGPGGYGTPPPPYDSPHGMPPGGSRPPREPFFKRNRVLLVAAITAIITSAIVGPAAAVISTYFLGGPQNSLTDTSGGSVSSGTVSNVAEAALPSVVSIEAGPAGGSGVIISSDGQILTNNHVVAGAEEAGGITVQFNDGSEAPAEVLGADPVSDLAVIQARGQSGLTAADLGDSDKVEVGADVVAIGSPLGLSGTVTSGVVSAVNRPVNTGVSGQEEQPQNPFGLPEEQDPFSQQPEQQQQGQTSTVINAIQTDAPINPGNSGGPLMNMSGEVIGINTAIVGTSGSGGESGSIGLGFAIPINQAKPIAEQLIEDGSAEYAAIEATISGQTESEGAAIVETTNNGAADQAGLREGDVITSIEGEQMESPDAVIAAVRSHQPGDTITVGYVRDGRERETEVTLSAQSSESIGN